jgi:hypothetical protein
VNILPSAILSSCNNWPEKNYGPETRIIVRTDVSSPTTGSRFYWTELQCSFLGPQMSKRKSSSTCVLGYVLYNNIQMLGVSITCMVLKFGKLENDQNWGWSLKFLLIPLKVHMLSMAWNRCKMPPLPKHNVKVTDEALGILKLTTTLRPLHPRKNSPRPPFHMKDRSGHSGEKENTWPCRESNSGCPGTDKK